MNQSTCQSYLKSNSNITDLTITESIESNQLTLKYGCNYITSTQFNTTQLKKGYVPIIRLVSAIGSNNALMVVRKSDSIYSDYIGLNGTGTFLLGGIRNLTTVKSFFKSTFSNIAVQFSYENLTLTNLTVTHSYLAFGTFQPYLITIYNGNLYKTASLYTKSITVRNIDNYQYQSKNILIIISYFYFINTIF